MYKKAKQTNNPETWKKYKNLKSTSQKMCRQAHDTYVNNLITADKSNKKIWSYIKSLRRENTGISDLINNNKNINNPLDKANIFNDQFSKVFSKPCSKSYPPAEICNKCNSLNNITVGDASR